MIRKVGITLSVMIIIFSGIHIVMAQQTYTQAQYLSMLPTLDKIDLSKIPVSYGGDWSYYKHRTWYIQGLINTSISPTNDKNLTELFYIWKGGSDNTVTVRKNIILAVWYNTTTKIPEGVMVFDWDIPGVIPQIYKEVADYSIQDLPLLPTPSSNLWLWVSFIFVFILVIIMIGGILAYHKHK